MFSDQCRHTVSPSPNKTGEPWPGGAHLPGRRKNSEQRMFLKKIVKININIFSAAVRGEFSSARGD